MLGKSATKPVEVGERAPEVVARDENGKSISFKNLYKRGWTLVYFYPKAGTPGCTAQACSLRDGFEGLQREGVQVVGVSRDTPLALKAFKDREKLPFILISDKDGAVQKAFGVPSLLGLPIASRQSFLIQNGVVVWRDLKSETKKAAQEVLEAIREVEKQRREAERPSAREGSDDGDKQA